MKKQQSSRRKAAHPAPEQPQNTPDQVAVRRADLSRSRWIRYGFILVGIISLILGIIGVVTPILPTTPFILLSGFCFARGSDRLHNWILAHRFFGPMIRAFRDERRIPLKVKIFASAMIAVTMSITAFFIVPLLAVKIGMAVVGAAVIAYIWTFRN